MTIRCDYELLFLESALAVDEIRIAQLLSTLNDLFTGIDTGSVSEEAMLEAKRLLADSERW